MISLQQRLPLWTYISLVCGVIVTTCLMGFGAFIAQEQYEIASHELRTLSGAVVEHIDAGAADALLEQRWDSLEELLTRTSKLHHLRELTVTNAQGKVVAQVVGTGDSPGRPVYSEAAPRQIPRGEQLAQTDRILTIARPIVRGEVVGAVFVSASLETVEAARWRILVVTMLAALIAAGMAVVLIGFAMRRPATDLRIAAEFARSLRDQKGTRLEDVATLRESEDLFNALNQVSMQLSTQHKELIDNEIRKSAILESALDCFVTIDDQGRLIDFNAAAERTFGYRADQVLGLSMAETLVPAHLRAAHEAGMARYLQSGQPTILRKRIEIIAVRASGEIFPIELIVVPFVASGRSYFAGFMRDISEQKELQAEQERLTGELNRSLSDLAYQQFALDQHAIVSIANAQGQITYANQNFSDISEYSATELLGQDHRIVKSGVHDALFYQAMWDTIGQGKVWHGTIANRNKSGGIYWVETTIVPWMDDHGLPYQYVSIRTDITAMKNAELALAEARTRELEVGHDIQQSLLLGDTPDGLEGVCVATFSMPSQGVDGDFFAITRFGATCFEILLGDVMGKGVPAALIGAGLKSAYNKVLAELFASGQAELPSPQAIINALHQKMTPRLIALSSFVTLALYRIDVASGLLTYVNAGHTPALMVHASDGHIDALLGENLPIGVLEDEFYKQIAVPILPRDFLLGFSDGITESRNSSGEEFGEQRLREVIQTGHHNMVPPQAILQSLRQTLNDFVGTGVLADDQTAILIGLHPAERQNLESGARPPSSCSILTLPWRLDALAPLREKIRSSTNHLSEEDLDAVVLASFEAATNILRHAKPSLSDPTLTCRVMETDDDLVVDLMYPGAGFSPPAEASPDFSGSSSGGFGLFIIESCVDQTIYESPMLGISTVRLVKHLASSNGAHDGDREL